MRFEKIKDGGFLQNKNMTRSNYNKEIKTIVLLLAA